MNLKVHGIIYVNEVPELQVDERGVQYARFKAYSLEYRKTKNPDKPTKKILNYTTCELWDSAAGTLVDRLAPQEEDGRKIPVYIEGEIKSTPDGSDSYVRIGEFSFISQEN